MVMDAVFCALITILSFVPYVGFIPLGFTTVTDVHVIVIIGAILLGPKDGAILGAWMGICSLIKGAQAPENPFNFTFVMPWVSVLPRALFGFLAGLLYTVFSKLIKVKSVAIAVTAGLSTIAHTLMVFVFFMPTYLVMSKTPITTQMDAAIVTNWSNINANIVIWLFILFMFNSLLETALAIVVCTPINRAIEAAFGETYFSEVKFGKKKQNVAKDDTDVSKDNQEVARQDV